MRDRPKFAFRRRRRLLRGMPIDVVKRGLRPSARGSQLARSLCRAGTQLEDIRNAVRRDPSLAVATFRHAYKTQRERTKDCTDLDQLVTRLGSLAMSEVLGQVAALEPLDRTSKQASVISSHSVRVAALSCELAKLVDVGNLPMIYVTSLLHDIGKLLTIQSGDLDYESTPSRYAQPDLLNVYERRTLGYDHAKLGWHALSVWGVPEPLPTTVAWHHQGSRAYMVGGEIATLVALVRAADMLERLLDRVDELDEVDLWRLERNLACRRLELAPDLLRRQWSHLQKARAEALPNHAAPLSAVSAV